MTTLAHTLRQCVQTRPAYLSLVVKDMLTWYSPGDVEAALDTLPPSEHTLNARQALHRFFHPEPANPKSRLVDISG